MKHIGKNHAELNENPEQLQSVSWKELFMSDESKQKRERVLPHDSG